jgi:radical SAM superfamily enzyme YgiQ (UPF0313 family)
MYASDVPLAHEVFRGKHPAVFLDDLCQYLTLVQTWNHYVVPALLPEKDLRAALRGGPMPTSVVRQAKQVLQDHPSVVGISVCYTRQVLGSLCLAKEIRRHSRARIVMGGTYFNDGVPEAWGAYRGFLDQVVVGAGEEPLVRLLSGEEPQGVPGVIDFGKGTRLALPPDYDLDLDGYGEPDFSDLDLTAYLSPLPVLPILTSRGCYWHRCAFCAHFQCAGTAYQQRSIPAVVEELAHHVDRGVRHFSFVDSIISPARFLELADAILAAGLDIRYYATAKPTRLFTRQVLARMVRSGCKFVIWGLESASQRVLDLMDKGTRIQDVQQVLEDAHAAGLRNHVFTMFGFPTETEAEFDATLRFLARNKRLLSVVHRTIFNLEQNTVVYDHPERFSIVRMRPRATDKTFDFECSVGMDRPRVERAFEAARPFLRSFSGHPRVNGDFKFRDHTLLFYCREDFTPAGKV